MAKEIYWRVFLNTREKDKAKKLSADVMKSFGSCEMISLEPYWKDKSLYCLELTQGITKRMPEEVVFEVLKKVSLISNSWSIDLPEDFDDEDFDFSGVAENNFKWNYISWISFIIQDKNVPVLDIS